MGNSQIALSYIKTPPHFSFQRESRNLEPLSKSHVFSEAGGQKSKTFISPGVGDYYIEKVDVRKRSPVVKIGNSPRFQKMSAI